MERIEALNWNGELQEVRHQMQLYCISEWKRCVFTRRGSARSQRSCVQALAGITCLPECWSAIGLRLSKIGTTLSSGLCRRARSFWSLPKRRKHCGARYLLPLLGLEAWQLHPWSLHVMHAALDPCHSWVPHRVGPKLQ